MTPTTPSSSASQLPFQFTDQFKTFVELNPDLIGSSISRISERLDECNDFRYLHTPKGTIYPYASPAFITEEGLEELRKATQLVANCYEDLAGRMKADPSLTEKLLPGLDEMTKSGFLQDHAYRKSMPIYRLDLAMTPRGLQMMEINTGCPGGELDGGLIGRSFLDDEMLGAFGTFLKAEYKFSFHDPREDSLVRLLECYAEFRENSERRFPEDPTIALVTSTAQAYYLIPECRGIAQYYRERGHPAMVGDLFDLERKRGKVTLRGKQVHLIFRKFSTESFLRRMDAEKGNFTGEQRKRVRDLFEAYLNREVCIVNPLFSTVMQDKGLLVHTREEYPQLQDLIPETHLLSPDVLAGKEALADRIRGGEEFVLKRRISYGGKWVKLDPSDIRRSFDSLLHEESNQWIAQRRVVIPKGFFLYADNARYDAGQYLYNINSFGESFFLRVSPGDQNTPINASQGGAASSLILVSPVS
jgi:glutathionylspermidine synthase